MAHLDAWPQFFDVRFYKLWAEEFHFIARFLHLPGSAVRTTLCFQSEQAGLKLSNEGQQFTARQLLPENGLTLFIHTMQLKNLFC